MGESIPTYKTNLPAGILQTIIVAILLGLMAWVASTVSESEKSIVRLEQQVINLSDKLDIGMADRYRGADAKRDFREIERRINSLERSYENLVSDKNNDK